MSHWRPASGHPNWYLLSDHSSQLQGMSQVQRSAAGLVEMVFV